MNTARQRAGCRPETGSRRSGKFLVLFSILLPALLSVSALVIDVGMLLREVGDLEHIADAAATAAARDLLNGKTDSEATSTANAVVTANSGGVPVTVTVNIPPADGPHASDGNYAEVLVSRDVDTNVLDVGTSLSTVSARAVAGHEDVTGDTAIIVLSDQPVSWQGYYGYGESGLTILGSGSVDVTGAVLVNDESGQYDESWNNAGTGPGAPFGIYTAIPFYIPHARVVGGVNNPSKFNGTISGVPPLSANRMPVDDPLEGLPVPTVSADPNNVNPAVRGSVEIVNDPGETELQPGVYDWIRVIDSHVDFEAGVFIICNVNPATNIGLEIQGDQIHVQDAMFYITDNTSYSANSGMPDAYDEVETAPSWASTTTPSVDIRISGGSYLDPLDDSLSPYDGILVFQRRWDRRWLRLQYLGSNNGRIEGTVYAPAAKISVYTDRDVHSQFVVGTLRLYNYNGLDVYPPHPFPPVRDVFLVE